MKHFNQTSVFNLISEGIEDCQYQVKLFLIIWFYSKFVITFAVIIYIDLSQTRRRKLKS